MTALKPHPEIIETPLEGEVVLLDPRNQQMYSLNATGTLVWESLKRGEYARVAEKLSEAFEVEPADAQHDADALLEDLERAGLLVRTA